jgi:hypothetical protein
MGRVVSLGDVRIACLAGAAALCAMACGDRTGLDASGDSRATTDAAAETATQASGDAGTKCRDEIVARDPSGATALAVDGDTVFWGTTDGRVQRHDASGAQVLAQEASSIDSVAFAADTVYYTTRGALRAVPAAGGPAVVVADQLGQPFALSVDQGVAFLLDRGDGIGAGRALRVEGDGTVIPLVVGLDLPTGLAVDASSVYVACGFALSGGGLLDGPLLRVPKTGGPPAVVTSGLKEPSSVAVQDPRVYFIDQVDAQFADRGGIEVVDASGGVATTIAPTPGVLPVDLTVDPSGVYFTTYSNTTGGALVSAALDGSHTTPLAKTPGAVYGAVRTSARAIYWTIDWSGAAPSDGASVRKHCK